MAAINFPLSPSTNDTFTSGSRTWKWNGSSWKIVSASVGPTGPTGPIGIQGPTGPTGPESDLSSYATKTYADSAASAAASAIVDSAPGALNTLNELAAALSDDANFATTVTNSIANIETDLDAKANISGASFTGAVQIQSNSSFGNNAAITIPSQSRKYLTVAAPSDVGVIAFASGLSNGAALTGLLEFHDVTNTLSTGTRAAYVAGWQSGTTANNLGSRISFATKPDGVSSTGVERLNIYANGQVVGNFATLVVDISANYTITNADAGKTIRSTGGAITVTIPNVLNIGDRIDFAQFGSGQITFQASGVNLRSVDSKVKTGKQYAGATVMCVAAGEYMLIGNLG
jgi:hypothetical protein